MLVVWGRRQPLCCHSEIHVEVAQQTHTAELLRAAPVKLPKPQANFGRWHGSHPLEASFGVWLLKKT